MELDRIYNKSSQRMTKLPDNSIDTIMTSPPYWGLRDYGEDVKEIWGGDEGCEHQWTAVPVGGRNKRPEDDDPKFAKGMSNPRGKSNFCSICNAWHGQLGLEPTFQLYLNHMMIVCAEIKRVLKKTGSFWLNMGDTYSATRWSSKPSTTGKSRPCSDIVLKKQISLPSKCLLGIPWRLVLRLVDEQGWILRNAGIWNKPNSMPSSTKDRLSNSYEFLFHLVKNTKPQYYWNEKTGLMADRKPSKIQEIEDIDWEWRECSRCLSKGKIEEKICPRCKGTGKIKHSFWHSLGYWYDLDAIREPHKVETWGLSKNGEYHGKAIKDYQSANVQDPSDIKRRMAQSINPAGKNPGDVWLIPTQPRPEAHFATFPDKLCIKPILATCPTEICRKCGKARVRITKVIGREITEAMRIAGCDENGLYHGTEQKDYQNTKAQKPSESKKRILQSMSQIKNTIGWTDCGCNAGWDSGILLDPFAGRGTSLIMAKKLGRHFIGYELKKEYCEKLIKPALEEIDPLFNWKTPSPVAG